MFQIYTKTKFFTKPRFILFVIPPGMFKNYVRLGV